MEEWRLSVPGDEPALKKLWSRALGDAEESIDGFFEKLYEPGMASVCALDGRVVSAAYVLRLGDLVLNGRWIPCRLLYACGTDPAYRGRGIEERVLRDTRERATASGAAVVCPAKPPLFGRYGDLGFTTFFFACERGCTDVGSPLDGTVNRVTVRGYAALREELLHGRPHIDFDIKVLEYQEYLCRRSGGGLYYAVIDGTRCCAAVELTEDQALIRELIVPTGSQYNAAALLSRAVRRERFTYSAPVRPGDGSVPFAMLSGPVPETGPDLAPWLGFNLA